MTIQIPEAVQWLVPIVVGADWPEGDEDALRRLAQAWEQAATAIGEVAGDGDTAAQAARSAIQGAAADAFAEHWDRFVAGDEQFLVTLQQACEQLGQGCDETALNIEYTKLSIIAALIILAAQIAAMVAAAFATLGASTAGIPIAQAATRITVQLAFRELIRKIATDVAINVSVDAVIQGLQIVRGDRALTEWDLGKTVDTGISGMAAGVASGGVGLASGALGATTSNFGAAVLRSGGEGAIAGAGGNALNDLAHGNAPSLQSLGSGAASGSIGGALGGMTNRHEGLDETWRSPASSDYTAGANTRGWRFTMDDGVEIRANVDTPYTGAWNSSQAQHIPAVGGPNNVNVDNDDYLLPTSLEPTRDT
jgi:hypothetical protein